MRWVPREPGPHGPPVGWWTVKKNGLPARHFAGRERAERFATDPEYSVNLAAGKAWEKAKGNDRERPVQNFHNGDR
jgi:hypothetical protein